MADCPRCGKRIEIFNNVKCISCATKCCKLCGGHYGSSVVKTVQKDNEGRNVTSFHVSRQAMCHECRKKLEARIVPGVENANPFESCPNCGLGSSPTKYRLSSGTATFDFPNQPPTGVQMLVLEAYCPKCNTVFSKRKLWSSGAPFEKEPAWNEPKWYHYSQARLAESVERLDDAADHYEKAGFFDKAKELRIKGRKQVVHHVTVDVNRMIEFLRDSHYTIPYKCPSCKATIKINDQREASKFFTCEYCGTSLQAIDIQEVITSMM